MPGPAEATSLLEWAIENRDMVPHLDTLTFLASEAQTIVEFGTRGGVSTWAFLDGLPRSGVLYSVDIENCDVPPRVKNDARWRFIVGDDREMETLVKLPATADLVFIDTSHEYRHTLAELRIANLMKPKAIALHDAEWPGVKRAVKEFCEQTDWKIDIYAPAKDKKGPFGLYVLR